MKRNREFLEKVFPVAYIQQGLNATRAYKQIKCAASYETARVEGSRILAKPAIQRRIQELLPDDGVEAGVIRDALYTKPFKGISWAEKHKFLETSLKLKGYMTAERADNDTNIGIIIER